DAATRPAHISQRQPLEFAEPVERGMFHSFDFRNVHQTAHHCFVKNLAVRREHPAQLEGQHVWIASAHLLIDRCFLSRGLPMQTARLEQDWTPAMPNTTVQLLPIEFPNVITLPFYRRASHNPHL